MKVYGRQFTSKLTLCIIMYPIKHNRQYYYQIHLSTPSWHYLLSRFLTNMAIHSLRILLSKLPSTRDNLCFLSTKVQTSPARSIGLCLSEQHEENHKLIAQLLHQTSIYLCTKSRHRLQFISVEYIYVVCRVER